jgi:hypothetical protein
VEHLKRRRRDLESAAAAVGVGDDMESNAGFWMRKQVTDSTSIEAWVANRKKKLLQHQTRNGIKQI